MVQHLNPEIKAIEWKEGGLEATNLMAAAETGGRKGHRPPRGMTIISWNCQGLGHPQTDQELVYSVHTYRPSLVFISKTRQNKE